MTNPNASPNTTSGNKSEQSAESAGPGHLKVLTEMADKFNPEQARNLVERDKPKTTEKTPDDAKFTRLAVIAEKQEKELSPQDAANEYLSLLDELSKDFTNPTYQDEYNGQPNHRGGDSFTWDLANKYSNNPNYNRNVAGSDPLALDRTTARMGTADAILKAELGWRIEGEKVSKKIEQINKELADLDESYAKKGRLAKFFGKRKYEKAKEALGSQQHFAKLFFERKYNGKIENELVASYDETGGGRFSAYPSREARSAKNEEYNRRFFGLDDPERAAKVERAIELRQKYESEWSKKK